MERSEFTYQYALSTRRGVECNIGVRVDPGLDDPESFAAVLFFQLDGGTRIEVARIDDTSHDGRPDIHIDRFYRERGAETKDFDIGIAGWEEADAYLEENWKRFVDRYYRNHGHAPREDGKNG